MAIAIKHRMMERSKNAKIKVTVDSEKAAFLATAKRNASIMFAKYL